MNKFFRYFSFFIVALYFILGIFILVAPMFDYLSTEIKVIFASFLFLYGGFRFTRIIFRNKRKYEEDTD